MKYKVIKTLEQYNRYCQILENLTNKNDNTFEDEIELLILLVERWDMEHNSFQDLNPIELIRALMRENGLKQKDLVTLLELSKGTVSKILNYQKGLSKASIRKLAKFFRLAQEAFNRPYTLNGNTERKEIENRQDLMAH